MSINHKRNVRAALMGSAAWAFMAAPVALAPSSAMAQDQTADDGAPVDQIVITGSRIPRAGFDTLQPAINIDSQFLDDRGFENVADALNEVPAFGSPVDNSGGQSSQTLGQNFANAFGLGVQRTLTLINGRRTVGQNTPTSVGGQGGSGLQVDLNIIPTALIERVETIFIGGAPIYGTDAIAGTVNIILKDDYEGITADVQYGIAQTGVGESFRARGLWGANTADGKGNVTLAAEYSTIEKIDARDVPLAARQFGFCNSRELGFGTNGLPQTTANDGIPDFNLCEDAANVWQVPNSGAPLLKNFISQVPDASGNNVNLAGRTLSANLQGFLVNGDPIPAGRNGGNLRDASGNTLMFDASGNLVNARDNLGEPRTIFFSRDANGFNNPLVIGLNETNTLLTPLDRWMINGKAHYEIAEGTRWFLEALYARSESTDTNNQPPWATSFFRGQGQGEINIFTDDNPFVSNQLLDSLNSNWDRIEAEETARIDSFNISEPLRISAFNAQETIDAATEGRPAELLDAHVPLSLDSIDRSSFKLTRSGIDLVQGAPNFRDQDVFRFVSGFEGDVNFLGSDWTWDTAFIFGETNAVTRQSELNRVRHALALDSVIDPETGLAVCRSTLEGIPNQFETIFPGSAVVPERDIAGCFALNPFGLNDLTTEQRDYLVQQNFQSTKIRQLVYEANIAGDLLELPAGMLSVAAGFTHRRELGVFQNDAASFTGAFNTDAAAVNSSGKFSTTEFYGETLIPLITDGEGFFFDVPFIASLQLDGAIRFVDNSRAGSDLTWTAGGRLRPNLPFLGEDLLIRGNFTKSIRAPSIPELFQPVATINTFAQDPCDPRFIGSGNSPAVRAANCATQVAEFKAAGTIPQTFSLANFVSLIVNRSDLATQGGNVNLRNEKADSWTVGGVFAPSFLPGFELTVDWTRIQLNDAIVALSGTQLLNACFDSTNFPAVAACGLFQRDETFQIRNPQLNFLNAAQRDFAGLTSVVSYTFEGADIASSIPGSFQIFGSFFHVAKHEQVVAGGDLDIFAGERRNEKFQFQLNLRYNIERFMFLWQTRHIGSHIIDRQERADRRSDADKKISAIRFHNLTMTYQINDNFGVRAVVNNVFNKKDDQHRGANGGGNTLNFNDVIGRRFLFAINANF